MNRGALRSYAVAVSSALFVLALSSCTEEVGGVSDASVATTVQGLGPSPDTSCAFFSSAGRDYWFCNSERSWQTARTRCQAIGLDLVSIGSATENSFVRSHVFDDSWIGGNDIAVEGVWRWAQTGTQFWQGGSGGSAVGGAYTNWALGQPSNTSNQDCAIIDDASSARWSDESCTGIREYVCEGVVDLCPADPSKTLPGQCGCGTPDTDGDGDGVANCVDGCPIHSGKTAPGQCGCAAPDTDGDGDGVANCVDGCPADPGKTGPGVCGCGTADGDADDDGAINCEDLCPNDPARIEPGDCGCANAPQPSGTACNDGLCAANTQCNGVGRCGNPTQCGVPDSNCEFHVRGGTPYWFCENDREYDDALQRCRNVGMELAIIQSEGEDDFVTDHADEHSFLGGGDSAVEGTWTWLNGEQFWSGDANGGPVGSAYTNFRSDEPDDSDDDCLVKSLISGGQWKAHPCDFHDAFVCERQDACPADPTKIAPGACGCNRPETDSDSDVTPDCIDECPLDGTKTLAGICGCHVAETDSDGDEVPNCADGAPNDPTIQEPGSCTTDTGAHVPANTPCADGICRGLATCDGAGHCGGTACIPAGCVARTFEGKIYTFCTGPSTWAQAAATCRAEPGRHLVHIEGGAENAYVRANLTNAAWIGGNDQGPEGQWRWSTFTRNDGPRFWTGAADGQRYLASYTNWSSGQPSGGATEACAAMLGSGTTAGRWEDRSCGQTLAFACEQPGPTARLDKPNTRGGDHMWEVYDLDPTGIIDPDTAALTCVESSAVFGTSTEAEVLADLANCDAACCGDEACTVPSSSPEATCTSACSTGVAVRPPPGSTCAPATSLETGMCNIASPFLDGLGQLSPCEGSGECVGKGGYCGLYRVCAEVAASGVAACSDDPDVNTAAGRTGTLQVCGTPDDTCPDPNDTGGECEEVPGLICADFVQTTTGLEGPGSDLTHEEFDPEAVFEEPEIPAEVPYADQATPCPGTTCPNTPGHQWCNYDAAGELADRHADADDREGHSQSDSSLIEFDFDPNLILNFEMQTGALGLPKPTLVAEASLGASIDVGSALVPGGAHVDIVDIAAGVEGSRCGVNTDRSHLRLFGKNFAPTGTFSVPGTPEEQAECEEFFTTFENSVDRANKALRDAAALIRQYKAAAEAGNHLESLCELIAASPPRGFPVTSAAACAAESTETTIRRFIAYYERSVNGFGEPQLRSITEAAQDLVDSLDSSLSAGENLQIFSLQPEKEEMTIANVQFAIGPVPCNLEVYAALDYGVNVNLAYELSAGAVVNTMLFRAETDATSPEAEIASLKVAGEPYAASYLGVFAGVGFDIGPVAAKLGIAADLTLANLRLPAHAEVGVGLGSTPDLRPPPADLAVAPSEFGYAYLIPPKRYVLALHYGAGLSANITNVLHGTVSARLKIKFFFFSKTWSKVLLEFHGLPDVAYPLITVAGSADAAIGSFPWGEFIMPSPFPALFLATEPNEGSEVPLDQSQIAEPFYDSLCTCIDGDLPLEDQPECFRSEDCCDDDPICFSDPEPTVNRNVCTTCRGLSASCNETSDCCSPGILSCFDDPDSPAQVGHCEVCREEGQSCNVDTDCCGAGPFVTCFADPGTGDKSCKADAGCGFPCNQDSDCTLDLVCNTENECDDDPADPDPICAPG